MQILYRKFLNNGVTENLNFSQKNKIRIFNSANVYMFIISLFYTAVGFAIQLPFVAILSFLACIFIATGAYIISKGKYLFAFHFIFIYSFVYVSVFVLFFGLKTNSYLYYLFMPVACNILFDNLHTTLKYFVASLIMVAVLLLYLDNHDPIYKVHFINTALFSVVNNIFVAVLIFLGVRLFKTENYTYAGKIEEQKKIVEEKQKEILDSIHYAKRIQNTLLTSEKYIERNLNRLNKN
jgi:sigma-B regulation protein RsbU (phosphoserine phosphatase)